MNNNTEFAKTIVSDEFVTSAHTLRTKHFGLTEEDIKFLSQKFNIEANVVEGFAGCQTVTLFYRRKMEEEGLHLRGDTQILPHSSIVVGFASQQGVGAIGPYAKSRNVSEEELEKVLLYMAVAVGHNNICVYGK